MHLHQSILASVMVLGAVAVVGLGARQADPEAALLARAKAIHARSITIDTHVDIPGTNYATLALDPGTLTNLKCDLVKMKAGGLDGVSEKAVTEAKAGRYWHALRAAEQDAERQRNDDRRIVHHWSCFHKSHKYGCQ